MGILDGTKQHFGAHIGVHAADKIQYIFLFLMQFNTAGIHFELISMAA